MKVLHCKFYENEKRQYFLQIQFHRIKLIFTLINLFTSSDLIIFTTTNQFLLNCNNCHHNIQNHINFFTISIFLSKFQDRLARKPLLVF